MCNHQVVISLLETAEFVLDAKSSFRNAGALLRKFVLCGADNFSHQDMLQLCDMQIKAFFGLVVPLFRPLGEHCLRLYRKCQLLNHTMW
jgi:hypothetical protein